MSELFFLPLLFFNNCPSCVEQSSVKDGPRRVIANLHYETQLLIITSDEEVAVVHFYKIDGADLVKYQFRLLSKDGRETRGKGELRMKWITRVEGEKLIKTPDRKFTTIHAGRVGLYWQSVNESRCWFWYIPEVEVVQLGDPTYYEDVELHRFKRNANPKR